MYIWYQKEPQKEPHSQLIPVFVKWLRFTNLVFRLQKLSPQLVLAVFFHSPNEKASELLTLEISVFSFENCSASDFLLFDGVNQ